MILNDLTGIKYVGISITMEGYGHRSILKLTRLGRVLGYVARSLSTTQSPMQAGWSYCVEDQPERVASWTSVGPGSTRDQAADHLLSARSPMAAWLA